MKLSSTLPALILPLLLAACGSVEMAPSNAPSIVVSQDEERECGQGRILFPAGEYKAEVASAEGTYYKAPKRLRTLGVLIGRSEDGGIFVSNAAGNPQAVWFGDPKDEIDESPGTLFGAIGLSAPKLWPYKPRIPFSLKK
ncbi:MAG TPA: hypothetical protein DDZ88_06750 [Verrucomicrobiales bacterium]|nr:hypothetical protein [Verrucomicrobiales bacterium]